MLKIIHFVQSLSLDITAGAVINSLFIAQVFGVNLSIPVLMGLAIAIWLIYTVDHLMDARKTKGKADNPRHAFHQKHKILLMIMAGLAFVAGLINTFYLPVRTVCFGGVLAGLSGLYFLYLQKPKCAKGKALFAAFVYTAGVVAGPGSLVSGLELGQLFPVLQIMLLAYANLLLISLYEIAMDKRDQKVSAATDKGEKRVSRQVWWLTIMVCLLAAAACTVQPQQLLNQGLMALMATVLIALLKFKRYFRSCQLYRVLADGIFFLPLMVIV